MTYHNCSHTIYNQRVQQNTKNQLWHGGLVAVKHNTQVLALV